MTETAAAPSPRTSPLRGRTLPSALDLVLGVLVGGAVLWAMTFASGLGSPAQLPWTAFVAHAAVVVGTACWRVAPRAGLVIGMLGISGYHASGGAGVGLAWPLLLPCYGVARRGHLATGIVVALIHLLGMLAHRLTVEAGAPPLASLHLIAQEAALLAAALLVGEVVRSRARQAEAAEERLALVERRHEQETHRRIAQERLRIAHDLHDVAAHTVSIITLHASVAEERFEQDPDAAREAIGTIRTTSQQAARDLRAVVGVLRDGDDERDGSDAERAGATSSHGDEVLRQGPAGGAAAIRAHVERAAGTGLEVRLHLDADEAALEGAVGVAAARIVQESLTNVVRHAAARTAEVTVRATGEQLRIEIADDGGGAGQAPTAGGVGLLGMQERAQALGGSCAWGDDLRGGFVVTCRLPLRGDV